MAGGLEGGLAGGLSGRLADELAGRLAGRLDNFLKCTYLLGRLFVVVSFKELCCPLSMLIAYSLSLGSY